MDYHSVSWKQLHSLTQKLSEKIATDKPKIDLIVGVARGGLTISHIVSDFLQLPVASFTISSYKDLQQQELSDISYQVGGNLKGMHVLLVDDVSDTGKTFIRGIEHLKELGAQSVTTGSVFIKPWTKFTPDYYAKSVNEWIVFPFDMRDTVEDVSGFMKKDGYSRDEIEKTLGMLRIPVAYIKKYLP
jgi:hypoxanthine phosphoribosyltransferase